MLHHLPKSSIVLRHGSSSSITLQNPAIGLLKSSILPCHLPKSSSPLKYALLPSKILHPSLFTIQNPQSPSKFLHSPQLPSKILHCLHSPSKILHYPVNPPLPSKIPHCVCQDSSSSVALQNPSFSSKILCHRQNPPTLSFKILNCPPFSSRVLCHLQNLFIHPSKYSVAL